MGSYPLSSQAPTPVEVELGCDNMISSVKLFNYNAMGPVPKKSKIWDRSHVMRDWSHLDGTGTHRTHSGFNLLRKTKHEISQQPLVRFYPNFELKLRVPNQTVKKLHMKMISYGR
jgi:hypothetical protein